MQHYGMLKRIIRYLAETKQYGITYHKSYGKTASIVRFTNAAHTNQDEQKSIIGIVFTAARSAILWKFKKQSLSTQSSMKAEYIALMQVGCEVRWF
jgi:hypothetical protein